MRLLLDSSVLLTYVASPNRERSAVFALLTAAVYGDASLVWSEQIEHEVWVVLHRKPGLLRATSLEHAEATILLLDVSLVKAPDVLGPYERVCRDPDDDMIVATAIAAACDVVVTLDRDLLDLFEHRGVLFVKPGGALEMLRGSGPLPRA